MSGLLGNRQTRWAGYGDDRMGNIRRNRVQEAATAHLAGVVDSKLGDFMQSRLE